jgi:hypothetical protein
MFRVVFFSVVKSLGVALQVAFVQLGKGLLA